MKFEFDPSKSATNAEKHGIDFVQAQAVWADDNSITIRSRETPEIRFLAVGLIGQTFWSVVWTQRGESTRIISARRARANEVELYENARI